MRNLLLLCSCLALGFVSVLGAQDKGWTTLPLNDLSSFEEPPASWSLGGSVYCEPAPTAKFSIRKGTGVLVNQPKSHRGADLRTRLEHGDLDLDLEFMMAPGSNSGIYLQGNYEIQLFDSWGKPRVGFGDVGGIYERWDERRGAGREGYQGYAPAMNVAKAPGTWQHLRISFAAPRFDAYGTKVANARIIRIELNGMTVHENLELTGPTRGNWYAERPRGPLRFQGDHGAVAFRNIRYRLFDEPPLALENIYYETAPLENQDFHDWSLAAVTERGTTDQLTPAVTAAADHIGIYFRADLAVPQAGTYQFDLTAFGNGTLVVDGDTLIKSRWWNASAGKLLNAGTHRVEIVYAKVETWFTKNLALYVSGPGVRRQALHPEGAIPDGSLPNPIYFDTEGAVRLLRSFVDFPAAEAPDKTRLTHAVQVGFPEGLALTYDTKTGAIAQVWRGAFLDVTPMWDSRGDGSSRPRGAVETLSLRSPALAATDSLELRPRGYRVDGKNQPTFLYTLNGALAVADQVRALPERTGLQRELSWEGESAPVAGWCVAEGKQIEEISKGMYRVDGRYLIRLPAKHTYRPEVRTDDAGQQQLVLRPDSGSRIRYELLW